MRLLSILVLLDTTWTLMGRALPRHFQETIVSTEPAIQGKYGIGRPVGAFGALRFYMHRAAYGCFGGPVCRLEIEVTTTCLTRLGLRSGRW